MGWATIIFWREALIPNDANQVTSELRIPCQVTTRIGGLRRKKHALNAHPLSYAVHCQEQDEERTIDGDLPAVGSDRPRLTEDTRTGPHVRHGVGSQQCGG